MLDSCCKMDDMAYLVLARKYRPQTFDEVIGQEHVVRTLKNALKQGRLAHAFLFSGIRGVGKTTIARILAKAINCEQGPTDNPCNRCDACLEITEGRAVDVQEIDAASNRGIDEIRELRENVKFRPARLRAKVYIIDEAHMLTREAFNALLKTLEEPPPHVHFVLATTEPHKIPVTILSRCQKYEFKRLPLARLVNHLKDVCAQEGVEMEEEALVLIAKEAEGSVRDALSLLDQAISSGVRTKDELLELFGLADRLLLEELARAILSRDLAAAFRLVNQAFEQGVDLVLLAQDLAEFFRHLLVIKAAKGMVFLELPESELSTLRTLSLEAEKEELLLMFQVLLSGLSEIKKSPLPKLSFELTVAKACEVGKIVPLERLLAKIEELKLKTPTQEDEKPLSPERRPTFSWKEALEALKEESPPLAALLETLDPPKEDGEMLVLKAPEGSLLEDKAYQERLSRFVQERWGKRLKVEFLPPEGPFSKKQKLLEDPLVQETLKIFGGRVAQVKIYEKE